MANPPFAGSLDYENTAKDLLEIVKTKKTELLFLALFLRLLKTGGRAAVIVPDGVLFGSSKAHKELRRALVEEQKLDGVISLPSGVFKPYAGVSTAILLFTKTDSGGTDFVWFYDVKADGLSLDDKRSPLLPDDKQGAVPVTPLTDEEHSKNNLPDVLRRWRSLRQASTLMASTSLSHQSQSQRQSSSLSEVEGTANEAGDSGEVLASTSLSQRSSEYDRDRTAQSFCVPKADIVAQGYDLSLNRYKEVVHEEVDHRAPKDIIADLARLEAEIQQGMKELEGLLTSVEN